MNLITQISLSFLCGIVFFQFLPELPSVNFIGFLLIGTVVFSLSLWNRKKYRVVVLPILIFILGFCWSFVYASWKIHWSLPKNLQKKKILVSGHIASIPIEQKHYASFIFKSDSIDDEDVSTKLKLSWYGEYPKLIAGDRWQLEVRLKRPHGSLNPGGHNFETYLFQRGIRATGYVVEGDNLKLKTSNFAFIVLRMRQFLYIKMKEALANKPLFGVIIALIIGEQGGVNPNQWQVFRNSGTNYLMAISGLHIGLVSAIAFSVFQYLWKKSTKLLLFFPANKVASIFSLFIAVVYSALAGFSIPARRAVIMFAVFVLTFLYDRNISSWNRYFLGLLFVLIFNPLSVLSSGFWLSFWAVAIILYINANRLIKKESLVSKYFRMQLSVNIGLMPLSFLFFQQISMVSCISNIIAVPGVCFLVLPISLVGSFLLPISSYFGSAILLISERLMEIIFLWLKWCASLPFSNLYYPIFNEWIFFASLGGVLILLLPSGFPGKLFGLFWFLPILFYKPKVPEYGSMWFTLLDVGQGLSAVIQTQNHTVVYDTGPKSIKSDAGSSILVPFLRFSGIKTVDTLVVSHGDNDHIGGADSLLRNLNVEKVITSVPDKFKGVSTEYCYAGNFWEWDGVSFQFLFPPKGINLVGNNASCVLKVGVHDKNVILTGDIERKAEDILMKIAGNNVKSNILVVPHHGSNTSSTDLFVKSIAADYVLFSVGYLNRFKFPHKSVIKRYLRTHAELFDTATYGAIIFKLFTDNDNFMPELYRVIHKRYWQESP